MWMTRLENEMSIHFVDYNSLVLYSQYAIAITPILKIGALQYLSLNAAGWELMSFNDGGLERSRSKSAGSPYVRGVISVYLFSVFPLA